MLKVLSCLLSLTLIFTSVTPSLAQIRGAARVRKVTEGMRKIVKEAKPKLPKPTVPSKQPRISSSTQAVSRINGLVTKETGVTSKNRLSTTTSGAGARTKGKTTITNRTVLNHAQADLKLKHVDLLPKTSYVPTAVKIVEHANLPERALLLRSDFVVEVLDNRVQQPQINQALEFYRTQIKEVKFDQLSATQGLSAAETKALAGTAADISALGIVGTAEKDAAAILEVYQKSVGTAAEPAVTAAASHALLRLGAYKELGEMSKISKIHPELWEEIAAYGETNHLPLTIFKQERTVVDMGDFQASMEEVGQLPTWAVGVDATSTALYMNAGRSVEKAGSKAPASTVKQPSVDLPEGFEPVTTSITQQLIDDTGSTIIEINYFLSFKIFDSYFPVSISMTRTNNDTLFSLLRLFQIVSAISSTVPSGSVTSSGSPSKLGSGLPSPL